MVESLVPMVVMTGMFAMIFGIVYIRSRENMAMIEKGLNPKMAKATPRPYISLKYGLLLIGCGLGLISAYTIDHTLIDHSKSVGQRKFTFGGHHSRNRNKMIVITDTGNASKDTSLSAQASVALATGSKNDNGVDEDEHSIVEVSNDGGGVPIYFALIAIGGGLGLFFSYRIEKKEWLDKRTDS
ncbi:MAG: hypothetical protein JWQ38_3545 [Flavipsychrobacter sp.]|nr:hypothetical protein [Flavipsychrobacter sp.]